MTECSVSILEIFIYGILINRNVIRVVVSSPSISCRFTSCKLRKGGLVGHGGGTQILNFTIE